MEYEFMHNITFIETFLSYTVANIHIVYRYARILYVIKRKLFAILYLFH